MENIYLIDTYIIISALQIVFLAEIVGFTEV